MTSRMRLVILGILILAGGLRMGIGLARQDEVFRWPDSRGYLAIGRNVAEGEGFRRSDELDGERRTLLADRMPGYPLVLAGLVRLFGSWPTAAVVVLHAAAAMAGVWLVFLLGRYVAGDAAGIAAATILALHPWQIYFSGVALTEVWSAALLTALVLSVLRADEQRSPAWTVLSGFLLALLVYFNPAYLLLPAVVLPGLFFGRLWRRRLLIWATCVVILLAALSPWAVRNQQTLGHFVLTTTRLGPTLYDSLRPGADGGSDMGFEQELAGETKRLDETAYDAYYRGRSVAVLRQEPGRVGGLAWQKFLRTWSPVPNVAEGRAAHYWWASLGAYIVVMGGAALGAILLARRPRLLWMLLAPVLYITLMHLVIVGSVRYRLPVEPLLYVMAGAALAWVAKGAPEGQLNDRSAGKK